jgi:hypothetical protein
VIPEWVWKRRYSRSLGRNATIGLGLFVGIVGLFIVIVVFYARFNIEDVCTSYTCTLTYPGTPLGRALDLLGFLATPAAVALASGGLAYAISTWRMKEVEWAAVFGLQPFAKRLQLWYSQGKLSRQQVDEILADLDPRSRFQSQKAGF